MRYFFLFDPVFCLFPTAEPGPRLCHYKDAVEENRGF